MKRIALLWIILTGLMLVFVLQAISALRTIPEETIAVEPSLSVSATEPIPQPTPLPTLNTTKQKIYRNVIVPPGEYIVGEEIPAGVYACYCAAPENVCTLYVYKREDDVFPSASHFLIYSKRLEELWGVIDSGVEKVTLTDGNRVVLEGDEASFTTWIEGD